MVKRVLLWIIAVLAVAAGATLLVLFGSRGTETVSFGVSATGGCFSDNILLQDGISFDNCKRLLNETTWCPGQRHPGDSRCRSTDSPLSYGVCALTPVGQYSNFLNTYYLPAPNNGSAWCKSGANYHRRFYPNCLWAGAPNEVGRINCPSGDQPPPLNDFGSPGAESGASGVCVTQKGLGQDEQEYHEYQNINPQFDSCGTAPEKTFYPNCNVSSQAIPFKCD